MHCSQDEPLQASVSEVAPRHAITTDEVDYVVDTEIDRDPGFLEQDLISMCADEAPPEHQSTAYEQPLSVFDVAELHKSPYATELDHDMAMLSVDIRCYGRPLDRIYDVLRKHGVVQLGDLSANSARSLGLMEQRGQHPGLQLKNTNLLDMERYSELLQGFPRLILDELSPTIVSIRQSVKVSIIELLTRPNVLPFLAWHWEHSFSSEGRVFSSFASGDVWKQVQSQLGSTARIAGFILFSDSTKILTFSNRTLHPIYIGPAGLPHSRMNADTMTLLGFVPTIDPKVRDSLTDSQQKRLADWTKCLMASIYTHIIRRIHKYKSDGITIKLENGTVLTFHPFVQTAVSDHPEGNSIAMIEMGACRYCTSSPETFAHVDEIGEMRHANTGNPAQPLLHQAILPFHPYLTAHCIFHDVDEGIWDWILRTLLIPSFKNSTDQRDLISLMHELTPVPGIHIVYSLSETAIHGLTARQMRQLLIQMVLCLACWTIHDSSRDAVFLCVLTLCSWYSRVRAPCFTEHDLAELDAQAVRVRCAIRAACSHEEIDYDTKAVKPHIILHYSTLVRLHGSLVGQSCEKWDSAHRQIIKAALETHGKANYQDTVETRVRHIQIQVIFFSE
jgi:hypothetical protein